MKSTSLNTIIKELEHRKHKIEQEICFLQSKLSPISQKIIELKQENCDHKNTIETGYGFTSKEGFFQELKCKDCGLYFKQLVKE